MRLIFFVVTLFLMPVIDGYAQKLKISYDSVLNEKIQIVDEFGTAGSISIKDIKTKYVVLDFWATWCSPCIENQKVLEEIYAKNADSLTIVTISGDKYKRFQEYCEKWKTPLIKGIDQEGVLFKKYNVSFVPTLIFLNKEDLTVRVVEGQVITEHEFNGLKKRNYRAVDYMEKQLTIQEVKDRFFRDNTEGSFIKESAPIKNSYTFSYVEPIPSERQRLLFVNHSVSAIYRFCYHMTSIRTRVNYFGPQSYQCFNLSYMRQDLLKTTPEKELVNFLKKHHPEIRARLKKIRIDSGYYLVSIAARPIIQPSKALGTTTDLQGADLTFQKVKINKLINYLEEQTRIPIKDKTELKDFYDFDLAFKYEDPQALNTQLAKYGLKLELKRNVRMAMLFVENTYTRNLK